MFNINLAKEREQKTGHSYCSPSQLFRILSCPASLHESTKAPIQPPSVYADEGTRKHDVTAKLLEGTLLKAALVGEKEEDRQMILACVDYANDLSLKASRTWVEKMSTLAAWGLPEIWGTSDFGAVAASAIHVVDWKFGSGVQVYAKENEQLLAYAASMMSPLDYGDDEEVKLHIVQPAINHYDVWALPFVELSAWVHETLKPGLAAACQPDAEYNPTKKNCQFCPASMTCRGRYDKQLASAKEVFSVGQALGRGTVTIAELVGVYEKIQELNMYSSAIVKYMHMELSQDREVPGYKLVAGRSNRKWIDEDAVAAWLEGNSSITSLKMFTKKLLSPSQAEKLDRHLKDDDHFKALFNKPAGKSQLASLDDPRPAVTPALKATEVFKP